MSREQEHAIAQARSVLRSAVRYHETFGGGFVFDGSAATLTLTADSYATLLTNLRSLNFDADAAMRAGAFAAYDQRRDVVELQRGKSSRPALLHELVHAYQDYARFNARHWEVEATAYMAQALWTAAEESANARNLRAHLEKQTQLRPSPQKPDTQIFVEAARACLTLGLDRGVVRIGRRDITHLEQALRNSQAYRKVVDLGFTADGFNNRR